MRAVLSVLAFLWALPITAAGFLLAVLGGCRLLGLREGALDFLAPRRGPWAWFFARRWAAVNLGDVIVYGTPEEAADPVTRAHEREHQRQVRRLGLLHLVLYFVICPLACWAYGVGVYRDQPAELAARRAAGQE